MRKVKGLSLLVLALLLLSLAPAAAAAPPVGDGSDSGFLPPGLSLKLFVHYPRGHGPAVDRGAFPACTDASPAGCAEYSIANTGGKPIRWTNPTAIPYYVTLNYSTRKSPLLTQSGALEAIRASFAPWEAASDAGLKYNYQGTVSKATLGARMDGRNVVGWKAIQGAAIAVTYVWYYTATGAIAEFDMAFNSNFPWSYTPPLGIDGTPYDDPDNGGRAGSYDLRNIGTHEAGHTLMLNDLYDPSHLNLTMYGYGAYAELKKDTLAAGDDLGVKALY